jgi:ADP-L-glycero-D-manno-heptose 6-epimerase
MIILTGHSGFIGSHFLRAIEEMREPVMCLGMDDCWKFMRSFTDWKKVTQIIHQGAMSSTTEKNWMQISHYNQTFTAHLFDKAIEYQIPVKYASSASVYGNQTKDLKIINPLNQYAISKLIIDYYVLDHIDKFRHIQGFRYFNVYGSGEDHKGDQASPVSKFTKQIKQTGKLQLFEGSDKFYRDFVCVDDVVNVVMNNDAPSGIYDIGTGNPISFQDVAELVTKKEGGKIKTIPFPKHLKGKYQDYTCADVSWIDYQFRSVESYLQSQN